MASPRSKRRLFGIDRSGPLPSVTRRGAPLRPWTIPNLVGYVRLAAIPVFCVLAFSSDDGRDPAAALLYLAIAASDYLDGFLARATGQYSRMGALLDPVVDRLTVLAGAAVCWHFELLPRWALLVLAAREVVTLILAQLALRRGIDLEINWIGRIARVPRLLVHLLGDGARLVDHPGGVRGRGRGRGARDGRLRARRASAGGRTGACNRQAQVEVCGSPL